MLYPPEGKVPDRVPTETVRQQVAAELAHYLGHRNLQSTARYTALAPDRFKGGWQDLTRKPVLLGRRAMRPYSATWLICGDKP